MGNNVACAQCKCSYDNYENPIVKIYHVGKYHGLYLCLQCFRTRINIQNYWTLELDPGADIRL